MYDVEFNQWVIDNIKLLSKFNIYHYNTKEAKTVRLMMEVFKPKFEELENRIKELESRLENER